MNNALPWLDTGQMDAVIRNAVIVYTPRGILEVPSPEGIRWVERITGVPSQPSIMRVWRAVLNDPPMVDKGGNLVCPWIQEPNPDEYSDTEF